MNNISAIVDSSGILHDIVDAYARDELSSIVTVVNNGQQYNHLSVIKLSADEYHQMVVDGYPAIQDNVMYVVDDDRLNAYGRTVVNVATPVLSTDAANKQYVDTHVQTPGNGTLTIKDSNGTILAAFAANQTNDINMTIPAAQAPGNGTLTLKQGSTTLGTFSANQSLPATITIPAPGNASLTIYQDGVFKGSYTANATTNQTIQLSSGTNVLLAQNNQISALSTMNIEVLTNNAYDEKVRNNQINDATLYIIKDSYESMRGEQIKNLGAPTDANDAVTKNYVDTALGWIESELRNI